MRGNKKNTHDTEHGQLGAEHFNLINPFALPDALCEVGPVIEELVRLEQMQRRRVQFLHVQYAVS